jgi:hypothetical protein
MDSPTQITLNALCQLGKKLKNDLQNHLLEDVFLKAEHANPWFTNNYIHLQFNNIIDQFLDYDKLIAWSFKYAIKASKPKRVGIVAAGNIPLVCFQDILCVIVSGNIAHIKLSSKDEVLPTFILNTLIEIEPKLKGFIVIQEVLKDYDAVIATGSDNTSRYFEYYFRDKPHIIRGNRVSVAILHNHTTSEQMFEMGEDIFSYYGLGCRNVTKLYLEEGFDLIKLLDEISKYQEIGEFFKYSNNYLYHKSIFLLNKTKHLDTGFVLFKEDVSLTPPTGVVFYEYYSDLDDLKNKITLNQSKIQSIVGEETLDHLGFKIIPFGQNQKPSLSDYADGVDVMDFLVRL